MKKFIATASLCAILASPCAVQAECDKQKANEVILLITEGGIAQRTFNGAATVRYEMSSVWDSWPNSEKEGFVDGVKGVERCLNGQVTIHFYRNGKEVAKATPLGSSVYE